VLLAGDCNNARCALGAVRRALNTARCATSNYARACSTRELRRGCACASCVQVTVVMNPNNTAANYTLVSGGEYASLTIPPHAIHTLLYPLP
jgi:hypothetical protein